MHSQESKTGGRHPLLVNQIMLVFIVWFTLTGAALAQQYLCVAEQAAGFSYDKATKEWKNATFKASSKYLISKADGTWGAFQVTRIGDDSPFIFCKSDFNEASFLLCSAGLAAIGDFNFNKTNGRYLYSSPFGYYNVLPEANNITDENSDTPFLEIGKCSPF